MFHFLVKYDGWAPARDTIDRSRVFEYTDETLSQRFKPNGILDSDRISEAPALFASETGGSGNQLAHIGYIVRVRDTRNGVEIEYALDPSIPPVSNAKLEELSTELDIRRFELSRTHWAVKDVDLFKVLLQNRPLLIPTPKVFTLGDLDEVDDRIISVMMPFDPSFNDVYEMLKRTATRLNLECLRADDIWEYDVIIQDIVSLISRSRAVVCDCTGRNANVFYEIGIAHTLGKEVILITQNEQDIPFDLHHLRYVHYHNNGEGHQTLSARLESRLRTIIDD